MGIAIVVTLGPSSASPATAVALSVTEGDDGPVTATFTVTLSESE